MAEVGQRLGTGAYRLTALRKSQSRPVVIGESPAPLLVSCTFNGSRKKEDSTQGRREVSNRRATQCKLEKVPRVRSGESQQENWNLRCTSSVMLESSRCIDFVHIRGSIQSNITTLYLSRLQPLQQGKLLQARMTSWTSRAASIYPDNLRFPQQHRAFCTLILILTEQGSERSGGGLKRLKRLKLHPDAPQASTARRSHGWRSGSGSEKVPPLFRSRTAYYDILKVSSSATQSQIKTAYYKQSFIYHPDKNPGSDEATQLFSEISEAYTVLGSISLRRKYDHGILSQSDIQSAGRPSSKETSSRSTGNPQQQQHQQRARRFSQAGGKTMFDFDAFYKAHYGEQLQRERDTRARKQYVEEQKKKTHQKWKEAKMMEVTVAMLMALAGIILISLHEP
ncbi:dnaJ (Hsp40) homolog, subfamily C, member 30b [Labrus mixtus]|uniref:dnaJ (Hsp40) homolog, subfamily C, member 30b n=1 Tax=Labrus mixtus TaxID=508554 RepID=UPI0029C0542F|nr:dnaJ (Hsp40) homolog, subfamily C, member 30b [Labrus mixtus]